MAISVIDGAGSCGAFLSCFGKKGSKEADWGGVELIAPAIKATSPDPTRRALSVVPVYPSVLIAVRAICEEGIP